MAQRKAPKKGARRTYRRQIARGETIDIAINEVQADPMTLDLTNPTFGSVIDAVRTLRAMVHDLHLTIAHKDMAIAAAQTEAARWLGENASLRISRMSPRTAA